jgi:hypothetical protein
MSSEARSLKVSNGSNWRDEKQMKKIEKMLKIPSFSVCSLFKRSVCPNQLLLPNQPQRFELHAHFDLPTVFSHFCPFSDSKLG